MPQSIPKTHFKLQIDAVIEGETNTICNLFTGERCVKIAMLNSDYHALIRDGFFIRDGKNIDSANVLNTTLVYQTPTAQP